MNILNIIVFKYEYSLKFVLYFVILLNFHIKTNVFCFFNKFISLFFLLYFFVFPRGCFPIYGLKMAFFSE